MKSRTPGEVRRRRVLYVPGYDPFHPRRYRELYRREAALQARLTGDVITISPRRGRGGYGWSVRAVIEGAEVEAEIEVLVWSDIVKRSMAQGIAATYLQLARAVAVYVGSGALFRMMRLRKGPVLAGLYPALMLLAQLALGLLAAAGAGAVVLALVGEYAPGAGALAPAAAVLAGAGVLWLLLAGFRRLDGRLFAYYLMHDLAFAARARGAYPPELKARLADFADAVAAALAGEGVDEVLVVGHSSGAQLAVSVVAEVLRSGRLPEGGPALGLLTLGQSIPMMSFLPEARELRSDLRFLSTREEIVWVDVSAPGDGCAFALCDPVAVSGVAPPGRRWPLVLSCAFSRTLRPETWARLRWRFFRLHFQYLCAFDALTGAAGEYDYFRITAGPLTLGARFAGRAPSRSRIEAPASGYTSLAA